MEKIGIRTSSLIREIVFTEGFAIRYPNSEIER